MENKHLYYTDESNPDIRDLGVQLIGLTKYLTDSLGVYPTACTQLHSQGPVYGGLT